MGHQSLITALAESDPKRLSLLRSQFAASEAIFSAARELGPSADAQSVSPDRGPKISLSQDAELALAEAGIDTMRKRVDDLLAFILRRMKVAARIKLFGSVAAAASGLVSASLAVLHGTTEVTQLVAAGFSFIGGLVALLADQVVRTPSGVPIASSEEHAKVVEMRVDIERMALRLSRSSVRPLSDEELSKILDALDDQAVKMIRYQSS